ncbi:MAG: TIGR01906 family membrane protein [Erysipelotrichaceae bacterium]
MNKNKIIAIIGFCLITINIFLVSVDLMSLNRNFMLKEFVSLKVGETMKISNEDLVKIADKMILYFTTDSDELNLEVSVNGQKQMFFNQRELDHMVDVKALYLNVKLVNLVVGVGFFTILAYLIFSKNLKELNTKNYFFSLKIMGGILAIIIGYMLIDFNGFWTLFHTLLFNNDLWILNPATDLLINLVPEKFFFDLCLRIVYAVIMLLGMVWFALHTVERRKKRAN